MTLFAIWLALVTGLEVATASWRRSVLAATLEQESREVNALLAQRTDQHAAHMTSLSSLAQVTDGPIQSLFLELSSSIMQFYPRVSAIDLVALDASERSISTRLNSAWQEDIERIIRDGAARSDGELVMIQSPAQSASYLLIKRSPNNDQARYGLALEIDVQILSANLSGFWNLPNTALSIALPDGASLRNVAAEPERQSILDTTGLLVPLVASDTLPSLTQPLVIASHYQPRWEDLLPPSLSIGGPLVLAVLLVFSVLLIQLMLRARKAELGERLGIYEARLTHASRVNSLGEMASGMAHELNQPLTAILGQSQAGLRLLRASDPDVARISQVLDDNVAQAKRASAILARLREWSSRSARQPSPVSINECMANVVALVTAEAKQHAINLQIQADPREPKIMADAVEIEQLVFNLVRNALESLQRFEALQSTPDDLLADSDSHLLQSDAFTQASDSRRLVRLSSKLTGEQVTIEVFDNGPGISSDMQSRLFEPFATDKPNGMGLGLALCTRIAERSAGSLSIVSDPRKGTRATVSIPILES